MGTIDESRPYYVSSDLHRGVLPVFEGGALRVDEAGGRYSDDFALLTMDGNAVDAAGLDATFSGVFADAVAGSSGGLTIVSSSPGGLITLTNTNTFTGPLGIAEGATLALAGAGTVAAASAVAVYGTLDISANAIEPMLKNVSGQGSILLGDRTLTLQQTSDGAFAGTITGGGGVVKSGAGTLMLSGTNTYSGGTSIAAGTLRVSSDAALGSDGGALTMAGGTLAASGSFDTTRSVTLATTTGGFDVDSGKELGLDGPVSGSGALIKLGAGDLWLTDTNTYTGGTQVAAGRLIGTTASIRGDIQTAGTVAFYQAYDGTYGGAGRGDGEVLYAGGGSVTLAGDWSGFTGTSAVANATLRLTGPVGGSMAVGSGGRLAGNGTVGATAVQSGGTIAPGNSIGTVNVAGDLTFAAGSTYEVETEPGGTAADLIAVSGTATLAGRVLHIGFDGAYARAATYTILTAAGGIVGTFDGVSSTLAFLDPTLAYSANAVRLQLVRNDVSFADLAQAGSQRAVANGIESLGLGNAVYDAVLMLDDTAVPAAFDALSGEIHASLKTGLVEDSRIAREAVLSRMQLAFSQLGGRGAETVAYAGNGALAAPAPAAPAFAAWGEGFGSWGSSDGTSNAAKLDRDTAGFLVGGDAAVGGTGRLGFVAGYQSSSYDADGRSSSADADTYQLGLYGGTAWRGLNLRAGATYAWSDVDTSRIAAFPGFSQSLTGSTNAGTAQVFGEAGYEVTAGTVALEPFAGLAYVSVSTDGYTESGGSAALTVDSDTTEVTYTTLGIRAGADLPLGFVRARATGLIGWRHAFGSLDPTATNAFAGGTAFTEAGVPIAEDVAVVGAGLEFDLGPVKSMGIASATLGVSYDGQFGAGATDNAATGRLTLRF